MKKDFEAFCREHEEELDALFKESIGAGAKIEFCDEGEKSSIRMQGTLPMLFHGACEIVKQLARQEGKEMPGSEKSYVMLLCNVVLEELEENAECTDTNATSAAPR